MTTSTTLAEDRVLELDESAVRQWMEGGPRPAMSAFATVYSALQFERLRAEEAERDRDQAARDAVAAWAVAFRAEFLLALMAAAAVSEREALAAWMMANSYATGHGDTVADLLGELDWQHRARAQALTLERDAMREGLSKIAAGLTPPEPHGHYLAHREAVKVARDLLALPHSSTGEA